MKSWLRSFFDYAIKNLAFKKLLAALLGATPVGFKAWLATFVLNRIYDWVVEEGIEVIDDQIRLWIDKKDAKVIVQDLRHATRYNNESEWDATVDRGMRVPTRKT